MTADIVNLRRHRKRVERERQAAESAENRVRHGKSKAEKSLDQKQRALETQRLEGHKKDQESDKP